MVLAVLPPALHGAKLNHLVLVVIVHVIITS